MTAISAGGWRYHMLLLRHGHFFQTAAHAEESTTQLFRINDLTDTHDWLVLLWWQGRESVPSLSLWEHSQFCALGPPAKHSCSIFRIWILNFQMTEQMLFRSKCRLCVPYLSRSICSRKQSSYQFSSDKKKWYIYTSLFLSEIFKTVKEECN